MAVGCAALLVAAAAVTGAWLLERGVALHVDAPPLGAQWLPHAGPGTAVAVLVVLRGPELAARLPWRTLLGVSAVAALAWTMSLALVDGWQRGIADRLTTDTEYLHDVPRVTDVAAMLRVFAERIPGLQPESWTTHVAGHPLGALLVFVGLDRIGLPGGVPAALLCVLAGSSAGVAVAVTLRALGTDAAARAALPFGVLLPGAIWIGVSADGLFAGVLAWGVACSPSAPPWWPSSPPRASGGSTGTSRSRSGTTSRASSAWSTRTGTGCGPTWRAWRSCSGRPGWPGCGGCSWRCAGPRCWRC